MQICHTGPGDTPTHYLMRKSSFYPGVNRPQHTANLAAPILHSSYPSLFLFRELYCSRYCCDFNVLFYLLFDCVVLYIVMYVNVYYCHRVSTQLQLNILSYLILRLRPGAATTILHPHTSVPFTATTSPCFPST